MNVRSLFSGVGGLDLGLERAGLHVVSQCEIDSWRRRVLASHWPGTPCAEDVVDLRGEIVRDTEPRDPNGHGPLARLDGRLRGQPGRDADLLCGGFPCQDLSVAGRRAGLGGDRSGLFFEFARVAAELQPRWLLVENVPGLLSSADGRDFAVVLSTLADLGYGVAWRVLDARYFGVPQRRRRVFIVGCAGGDPEPALRALGTGGSRDLEAGECSWQRAPRGARAGTEIAGPLTRRYGKGINTTADDGAVVVADTVRSHPRPGSNSDGNLLRPGFTGDGHLANGNGGVRRLTPVECERLMSWPDNWTNLDGSAPDSRRYAACGDGVVSNVAEWIGRRIIRVAFDEEEQ